MLVALLKSYEIHHSHLILSKIYTDSDHCDIRATKNKTRGLISYRIK